MMHSLRSRSRELVAASLVGLIAATALHAQPADQWRGFPASPPPAPTLQAGEVQMRYLGNAGWEITDGRIVVLVDPFLTQFARWGESGPLGVVDYDGIYEADTARINQYIARADYILITHGHSDHAMDAGYIAMRTGAVVLGHETAANLARAWGLADSSIITVLGGEDYVFDDGFSVRVLPNIHSALEDKRYFNNGRGIGGVAPRGLQVPLRRGDYQEGGNLAYLIRLGGHEIVAMGSMNYLEKEMEGLHPDVALVGSNGQRNEIYDYTGRLLRALGYPAVVIPTHADSYGDPNPSAAVLADRERFRQEVAAASPGSRFISPKWFEPIVLPARSSMAAAGGGERRQINPPGISPLVPAYSVGMATGNEVFVSGMTGFKPGTQDIVEGGIAAQTRQTMENIRTTLNAAGATMADVVECTVFMRDMADYAAMNRVYLEYFPSEPPARATLAVSALPRPAALVEIKCSARRRDWQ